MRKLIILLTTLVSVAISGIAFAGPIYSPQTNYYSPQTVKPIVKVKPIYRPHPYPIYVQKTKIDIGFTVIAGKWGATLESPGINFQDQLGFDKNATSFEAYCGVFMPVFSVRASHQFQKSESGNGNILIASTEKGAEVKAILVASSMGISSSRLEIGNPMRFGDFFIEPMAVVQCNNVNYSIMGKDYNVNKSINTTEVGLGLHTSLLLTRGSMLDVRATGTQNSNHVEAGWLGFNRDFFWGVGVRHDRLKVGGVSFAVSGPSITAGIMF